jgi:hypothetical protein
MPCVASPYLKIIIGLNVENERQIKWLHVAIFLFS